MISFQHRIKIEITVSIGSSLFNLDRKFDFVFYNGYTKTYPINKVEVQHFVHSLIVFWSTYSCAGMCEPWHMYGNQRTAFRNWFSFHCGFEGLNSGRQVW